jgi:hypothetical protein
MKTHADRIAELEAESARRAEGKSFVQMMYEIHTGGRFRPVAPAAKVLAFPDPLGKKQERLDAWAWAYQFEKECDAYDEAQARAQAEAQANGRGQGGAAPKPVGTDCKAGRAGCGLEQQVGS